MNRSEKKLIVDRAGNGALWTAASVGAVCVIANVALAHHAGTTLSHGHFLPEGRLQTPNEELIDSGFTVLLMGTAITLSTLGAIASSMIVSNSVKANVKTGLNLLDAIDPIDKTPMSRFGKIVGLAVLGVGIAAIAALGLDVLVAAPSLQSPADPSQYAAIAAAIDKFELTATGSAIAAFVIPPIARATGEFLGFDLSRLLSRKTVDQAPKPQA